MSFTHFNFAAKEVQDRLKVCHSICNYIEDFAEIENNIGKSLMKVIIFFYDDIFSNLLFHFIF